MGTKNTVNTTCSTEIHNLVLFNKITFRISSPMKPYGSWMQSHVIPHCVMTKHNLGVHFWPATSRKQDSGGGVGKKYFF